MPDDPAKDLNFQEPIIDSIRAQKDDVSTNISLQRKNILFRMTCICKPTQPTEFIINFSGTGKVSPGS